MKNRLFLALVVCFAVACGSEDSNSNNASKANNVNNANNANNANNVNNDVGDRLGTIVHDFGEYELEGAQETSPCVQWTLNNDQPLYVNKVTLANDGWYHHSNWLIVPEDKFPGPDGFFRCRDRNYEELTAAISGTVLFAQSTQSREEVQDLPDGVVVKIPPRHKVIAGVHLLNLSPRPQTTGLRMQLDIVHPLDVEIVATPFRLSFYDLDLPPNQESHFTAECLFGNNFRSKIDEFDFDLYWLLPHYHGLGNLARVEIAGGPRDGEVLYELSGFNAEANGKVFDEPVSLNDADGLRFTCGFNNPRDVNVGWGIGDQEMCVLLGFARADLMFDASVLDREDLGEENGIDMNGGNCGVLPLAKTAAQAAPTDEEKSAPLYLPDSDETPDQVVVAPECEDVTGSELAMFPATLDNVHSDVFEPGCSYSSCHDAENPAFGLDLQTREGLHQRLLEYEVRHGTDLPLVDPGNAEGSWIYQIMASCEPRAGDTAVAYMPRNAPTLADPKLVAMVRDWIQSGALDE